MNSLQKPLVLLVEKDEGLRELNKTILEEAGYRVETPPENGDLLKFVEDTHPQVIVVGLRYEETSHLDLVSVLQTNCRTRTIPVVAISTATPLVAQAKAVPVTSAAVVAPYDISQLEAAVANALSNPPPAAVLPVPTCPPPTAIDFASEELSKNAQKIVLDTIKELRGVEPFKSRFAELTPDLVDNLGKMLEVINQGLRRSLSADQVFSVPAIQRVIQEHAETRMSEGIDAASAVHEYQLLAQELRQFVISLVGQDGFTDQDALRLNGEVMRYVDKLIREIIRYLGATNQNNTGAAV